MDDGMAERSAADEARAALEAAAKAPPEEWVAARARVLRNLLTVYQSDVARDKMSLLIVRHLDAFERGVSL